MKQYRCKGAYNRYNFIKDIGLSGDNLNIDRYKDNDRIFTKLSYGL